MSIKLTPAIQAKRTSQIVDLTIGLTEAEVAERRNYIGGSDANVICGNNEERIANLLREKWGEIEPEDLSDNLPVQMGTWTEDLNLFWLEKKTGQIVDERNVQKTHPEYYFIKARSDGEIDAWDAVVDAKHVNPFNFDIDALAQRYAPQLAIQMVCCGRSRAFLSVFAGNTIHEYVEVPISKEYLAQVEDMLVEFWNAVQRISDPYLYLKCLHRPEPVEFDKQRTVDMVGNNAWTNFEAEYVETLDATLRNKEAAKELKELVEHDVKHAFGAELQIKRSKNGSLRLTKVKK